MSLGKSDPPPAPDYAGAAQAQGAANIETARLQGKVNNPNVYNPYGQRIITGGENDSRPTITDTLTPAGQARFDQEHRIIQNVGNVAEAGLGRVGSAMAQPFDTGGLPPATTDFSADRQRVEEALLSRLEPQFARDEEAMRTRLLNSGIRLGTEPYAADQDALNRSRTDARMQAILAGGQEQSRLYGINSDARARGIQERTFQRNLPLNELNALRSGSQVTLPQFQAYQGSSIQPPNLFGAAQAQGQYDINQYNAQAAQTAGLTGGLFGLGAAALGAPIGTFNFLRG